MAAGVFPPSQALTVRYWMPLTSGTAINLLTEPGGNGTFAKCVPAVAAPAASNPGAEAQTLAEFEAGSVDAPLQPAMAPMPSTQRLRALIMSAMRLRDIR